MYLQVKHQRCHHDVNFQNLGFKIEVDALGFKGR